MERTTSSILKLTESCISRFEKLLALQNPRHKEPLENRLADLNIWADGVGALAKPGASLDSRLQGRVKDLALVKNVLVMLADSLDYYAGLAETDANSGGIQNLDSAIKNLALIGAAIRRTGKASRNRRADRTFNPDEHQELRKHLECVVLVRPTKEALFRRMEDGLYVSELHAPRLSDLQERLIEANLRRRHNFSLAQRRSQVREGLQTQFLTTAVPASADDLTHEGPPANTQKAADLHDPTSNSTAKVQNRAAPTTSGFSLASTAEGTLQYTPAAAPRYTPRAAKTHITSIASDAEFPQPPAIASSREILKCPCCCQALPVETFSNPKIWKQHVIEDLCPYTCVAENCPTPQLLFCTRNEWETHVKKSHLPQWQCPFCEEQEADYPTMESMRGHFQANHKDELLDNTLSTLLSWSAVQTMGIKSCPLCSSHGPEDSSELVDHVLRHAYEFALRALPWPRPIAHDLNVAPGAFNLPEDSEHAEDLQRWVHKAVHESERPPELRLCDYDKADHSFPALPTNLSEYSDYFLTNRYFDIPEDKSSGPQGGLTVSSRSGITIPQRFSRPETSEPETPTLAVDVQTHGITELYESEDAVADGSGTALWRAAEKGHEAIVQLLLEKGANIEANDDGSGRTALSWAAREGHEAIVQLLLEKGANIEANDKISGRTALSWAAGEGYEAVVQLLLEKGANIEANDNIYGQTPLSWAAREGHEAVVQLLLEKGANIEANDDGYGQTPLSWAAEEGHEAVVQLLLEKGANIEANDDGSGRTPLSWAAKEGHEAVRQLLESYGAHYS